MELRPTSPRVHLGCPQPPSLLSLAPEGAQLEKQLRTDGRLTGTVGTPHPPCCRTLKSHRVPEEPQSWHHAKTEALTPVEAAAPDPGPRSSGSRRPHAASGGSPRGNRGGGQSPTRLRRSDPLSRSLREAQPCGAPAPRTRTAASWAPCSQRVDKSPTGWWPPDGAARRPSGRGLSRPPPHPETATRQEPLRRGLQGSPRTAPGFERDEAHLAEHTLQLVPDDRGCPRCQRVGQAA